MKKILLPLAIAMTLSGCSTADLIDSLPDNRPNYKTSRTGNPLEIPPDLTQSSIDDNLQVSELTATDNASLAAYQGERNGQSQAGDALAASLQNIQSNGDAHWIQIAAQPSVVFKNAKRFWEDNGLELSRVDANIGIMETDWLEPRSNLPSGGLMGLLGKVVSGISDSGVRDKFRTRIDYDGANTLVYVTHYGASEEQFDNQNSIISNNQTKANKDSNSNFAYVGSARNPELEVEMLRRLNLYLHKSGKKTASMPTAKRQANSNNIKLMQLTDGTPALVMNDNFNRAWQLLGVAIDRAGYDIDGQNRQRGLYSFANIKERKVGLIFSTVERDITAYKLGLADQGTQQIAVIRSVGGQRPTPAQAQAVLQKIAKSI